MNFEMLWNLAGILGIFYTIFLLVYSVVLIFSIIVIIIAKYIFEYDKIAEILDRTVFSDLFFTINLKVGLFIIIFMLIASYLANKGIFAEKFLGGM